MTKLLLTFLFIFCFVIPLSAQTVDTAWVRRYNGPASGHDWAEAIAKDGSGNIYVTGYSAQSNVSPYNYDFLTIKYHPNGDTAWVRQYNGTGNGYDKAYDIAVDGSGNVYVTGYSYGGTNDDYFTIKYYPNGDTAWRRRYDGPGTGDQARGIAVDGSGNVYVTGYSHSGTNNDYLTIKYYPNGDTAWVRRYDGTGYDSDEAHDIVVDGSGNVYVTGYSSGYMTLYDYTTIKYSSTGDTIWVRKYDGPGNGWDKAYAIAIDASSNIYVTGYSNQNITSPYNSDYATIKYSTHGGIDWIKRYDGPGNDNDYPSDIAVDGSGNVYVTGGSWDDTTLYDYTTVKYYSNGDTAWIRRYNNSPVNQYDASNAIALDGSGNVYVTGYSSQSNISPYNHDYATIKYSHSGDELWVKRYNGPGNNNDDAFDIVVDGSGNVYVTGGSDGSGTGSDFATIKYTQFPEEAIFTRGNVNCDSVVNLEDVDYLVDYLFYSGPAPACLDAADINDDGIINNYDVVFLLNYLTCKSGATIPPPFPECGIDSTADGLTCESSCCVLFTDNPPVLDSIGDRTVDEGEIINFVVSATDLDSDLLFFSADSLPEGAVFDSLTRIFTWMPDFGQAGVYPSVHFEVCDRRGESDSEEITIMVNAVNHPPRLNAIGNQKYNEGDYIVLNVSATDLEGDSLIFAASNLPESAFFDNETGVFIWTPSYKQNGTYPGIHFEVTDGIGGFDSEDVTIKILNYPQGEVTGDGKLTISDAVYEINCLFKGGQCPDPITDGDVNCDGRNTVSDVVYEINYLFKGGPSPCAPPVPRFIIPSSNSIRNGLVLVSADNLSDTPVQQGRLQYSLDSLVWTDIIFHEQEPPTDLDQSGKIFDGFWDTESLSSGQYWLRVIITDTIQSLQGTEILPVIINKKPNPLYSVSYDSITRMVTFDGSPSSDTDGSVILYNWIFCDSTVMQGRVIQKEFSPGDSCQVNLTVFDNDYNSETYFGLTKVLSDSQALQDTVAKCTCDSIKIRSYGTIPQNPPFGWKNTRIENPPIKNDALGPVEDLQKDRDGKVVGGTIAVFFMVEAFVTGNPNACSTSQRAVTTFLYDGPGGPGPNGEQCKHKKEKKTGKECPYDKGHKCDPQNPPSSSADLCDDDYGTKCGPSKNPWASLQKIPKDNGGIIRWLDAPGIQPKEWNLEDSDFKPAGLRRYSFYRVDVFDYPGKRPCISGICKRCFIVEFKYNEKAEPEVGPKLSLILCPD